MQKAMKAASVIFLPLFSEAPRGPPVRRNRSGSMTTMFFIWVPLSAVNKNPVRCPEQTDTVHSIARVLRKLNG